MSADLCLVEWMLTCLTAFCVSQELAVSLAGCPLGYAAVMLGAFALSELQVCVVLICRVWFVSCLAEFQGDNALRLLCARLSLHEHRLCCASGASACPAC